MANITLRDIIAAKNAPDAPIMSHLTKTSGILATGAAKAANDGIKHIYQKLMALPTLTATTLTGSTTPVTINNEVDSVNLALVQSHMSEAAAVLDNYPGGASAFFGEAKAAFEESFMQDSAKAVIYGNDSTFGNTSFAKGFHQIAKANSKVIQMGGATGSRTSIFAVKWNPAACSLLFNGADVGAGQVIQATALNGGQPVLVTNNTTTGSARYDYQLYLKGYLGFYSATQYDVAAMTQIQDDTDDRPTAAGLDRLLDMVKADNNTFLYMSRQGKRLVEMLDDSKLHLGTADNDYNTRLDYWQGIPIAIDDNISDVETTVLD